MRGMTSTTETPLQKACRLAGGPAELARRCGVSRQAVHKWMRRVPTERVPDIVRATDGGVSAHELRPDFFPVGFALPEAVGVR